MTEIYQLTLTKKSLAAMPPAERRLLLLLGHATNEISVLQKLILVSGQFGTPHKFVDHVQSGQTLILMRVLIGKLYEAWELFKTRFQADQQIRTRDQPKFNAEALAALADLNKHFSTHSPLRLIRNRFSFHYKDEGDLVEQSFQQIPDAEAWEFYLSNMLTATASSTRQSWWLEEELSPSLTIPVILQSLILTHSCGASERYVT